MLEPITIIIIVLGMLGIGIFFKFLWKVIKWIWFVIGIFLTIFGIISILIYYQSTEIQQQWPMSDKLIAVYDDKGIILAIEGKFGDKDKPTMLSDISNIEQAFISDNYDDLTKSYYMIFFVNIKAFNSVNTVELDGIN